MGRRLEQAAREALVGRKRRLVGLGVAQAALEAEVVADRGDDLIDHATVDASVAGLEGLRRFEEGELTSIERALSRIDDGTYGQCEECGRPIEPRRLEAIPWTPWCRDCVPLIELAARQRARRS